VKARPLARLTVREIVERCFDLCARRRPGTAFVFIVDEMGQYVARSGDKLENLRAVVEQFGKVGLERTRKKQLLAPAWIVVTAQEKLEEVYASIGVGRVELPKLQDRFKYGIHLSPADIHEVATKRVLRKTREGQQVLKVLFEKNEGALLVNSRLERTHRRTDFSEQDFIDAYPYLPHYIDLSIDIMNGLRAQHGAPRHVGGANRTIIRQADQMIAGDRTRMKDAPVGALVSLDKIYELVEGNTPSEKQKDILDIQQRFEKDAGHPGLAARVAKALCLLEFVKDLPRTSRNIAALLTEKDSVLPALATAAAHQLPAAQTLHEWSEQLDTVLAGGSDDCVRMLAGEGKTIRELREKAARVRTFLTETNLEAVRQARAAVGQLAPALHNAGQGDAVGANAAELGEILVSPDLPERISQVKQFAGAIDSAFQQFSRSLHQQRFERYSRAIDEIRGRLQFLQLDSAARDTVLQPLHRRAVEPCDLPPFALAARNTQATLGEIRADLEALPGLQAAAVSRMQEILAKAGGETARVERIKLASFFTGPKDPDKTEKEQIDAALERLRERLYSLLDEGVKILWE